jgi:lambda repressor-like predicted transcriptional regulator
LFFFVYSAKSSNFAAKINKNMDIKARIEEVINEKGLTKKVVAERMGKFNQAFNSLLTNPKWETIELVATAIGISTQEMLFGIKPQEPAPQPEAPNTEASAPQTATAQADALPFTNNEPEQQAEKRETVAAIICPHCGEAIKLAVI